MNDDEKAFLWFRCPRCTLRTIYQVAGHYKYDGNNLIYFQSKKYGIIQFENPDESKNNSFDFPIVDENIHCQKCCKEEGREFPQEYIPVLPTLDSKPEEVEIVVDHSSGQKAVTMDIDQVATWLSTGGKVKRENDLEENEPKV